MNKKKTINMYNLFVLYLYIAKWTEFSTINNSQSQYCGQSNFVECEAN